MELLCMGLSANVFQIYLYSIKYKRSVNWGQIIALHNPVHLQNCEVLFSFSLLEILTSQSQLSS